MAAWSNDCRLLTISSIAIGLPPYLPENTTLIGRIKMCSRHVGEASDVFCGWQMLMALCRCAELDYELRNNGSHARLSRAMNPLSSSCRILYQGSLKCQRENKGWTQAGSHASATSRWVHEFSGGQERAIFCTQTPFRPFSVTSRSHRSRTPERVYCRTRRCACRIFSRLCPFQTISADRAVQWSLTLLPQRHWKLCTAKSRS